ncbi:MAG: hypothetical protein JWN83_2660 [Chitinophagaceae bacterium]|nr:hypothetical protein [Chitinophagaceae bacterium]
MKKTLLVIFYLIFSTIETFGQNWTFEEKTFIKGQVSGTITKGYLFKISSEAFYEIIESTRQRVRERNPGVTIYTDGSNYKLEIAGFDEPVICRKIRNVLESTIDGEFKGWDGSTIFKLTNGQIWQQSEYAYIYHYAYRPAVTIYQSKDGIKMKVEDVDEIIAVKKIK